MSELSLGGLRTFGVGSDALAASELLRRVAKRGAQHVVTLRCVAAAGGFDVVCDVNPVGSLRVEPVRKGPYTFASEADARLFVDEATLVLEYLGCDVS